MFDLLMLMTDRELNYVTRDIVEALRRMSAEPASSASALRELNNRLKPLGFRLELNDRPRTSEP